MRQVIKIDVERRRVYGIAMVSDTVDRQGDEISEIELEDAACRAVMNGCIAKVDHAGGAVGKLCASWPMTRDIAKALGFTLPLGKACWLVGLEVSDPTVWAAVKSGDVGHALSVGGRGERSVL